MTAGHRLPPLFSAPVLPKYAANHERAIRYFTDFPARLHLMRTQRAKSEALRDKLSVMKKLVALTSVGLSVGAADFPSATISNGQIQARLYLPDAKRGYYRGTRFDWSGVIYSLVFQGHGYYGPWFNKTDPAVVDFVYDGDDIVAGPCSAITGPADEFGPVGWEEAKADGVFLKIGIGALRKPDDQPYDHYRLYEIVGPGKWTIRTTGDAVQFVQALSDPSTGYGYVYRKTVRLTKGKPEMVLDHSLKNTGTRPIRTSVYNHNFLVLDQLAPGPGMLISMPFPMQSTQPPGKALAEIRGNEIVYLRTLAGRDVVFAPLDGFGTSPKDHQIRIEDRRAGAGVSIVGDRPFSSLSLWSIRSVVAMEPYIALAIDPHSEYSWMATYTYYTLPSQPNDAAHF